MKRLDRIEDQMKGTVTYELAPDKWVTFDKRAVEKYGLAELMDSQGLSGFMPTERVPVMQYGRRAGTVPGDFDLAFARSRSQFYDVRPGDLVREGDVWVAARNLGAGDLDCLVGFQRDDSADHEQRQTEIRDDVLAAIGATSPPRNPRQP